MKRNQLEIESDITLIVEFLKLKYQLPANSYGETYPDEIIDIMKELETIEDKQQYKTKLEEAMICFKTYLPK